jgi:hypothetical protein
VVFVDDIDRCRPGTTAEVFEAINLFVSNVASRTGLWAHFVIGLDSAVVAARLDALYDKHHDPRVALHGDDPTPGWAFLRKLIQLPVTVPQVADDGVERFVDAITQRTAPASSTGTVRRLEVNPGRTGTGPEHPSTAPAPTRNQPKPATAPLVQIPVDTYTWRSMEQHPEVRGLMVQRLCAQPFRSIREAKRLLNVWQLYARILDVIEPLAEPAAAIARARLILLVAEIVTRWPALQRTLHRRYGNQRGLQLLADAVDDDDSWEHAVRRLGLDTEDQRQALTNLRSLLTEYDAEAITELAARLM